MPAPTLFDAAVDNRSLFSDYYLDERLPRREEWQEDVAGVFEQAQALYQKERAGLETANEAQTEERFIKPMLDLLGWHYDVQAEAKKQGRRNVPDYALFLTDEARAEAAALRNDENAYFARTAAVADAKYWGRSLDATGNAAREPHSNKNPSFQIVNYMTAAHRDWGILTNGARWRLYYAEARSRVDTYYEAHLEYILRDGSEGDFRRFWLFFRADAFRPDPVSGQTFLQSVYDDSVRYGKTLEDRLKDLIFEDIFLHLAEGFVERMDGDAPGQEDLDDVYRSTLRLLYRLLFLLYAEARALLPVGDRQGYYHYSLTRIKEDVAEAARQGRALSGVSTDKWNDLQSLFRIIDEGEAGLNVPHYNGGLFDRGNPVNAFLEDHAVADKHLVPAIDKLARDADGHFIDYKALDVEQLGSIYEGLLEFRLRMAEEDLAVVKEKGREVYKPAKGVENPKQVVSKGDLYLENDKGERKATGSYYTPDYIVEYITQHALGPVVEKREHEFRRLMEEEILPKREKLKRLDPRGPSAIGLGKQLEPLDNQAAETLLGVKVCDPAMGSGHFLVHAVDWLTERLITILNDYPENPVLRRLETIRTRILDELAEQDIDVDPERLGDTNLLKRMVMKRCIYGVDLNPMAVELARLSLWLDSFTVGAPLSFLNHHLKVGNALIGTDAREMVRMLEADTMTQKGVAGQLFAGGKLKQFLSGTEFMRKVAFNTDATFDEVKESAQQYDAYQQAMHPYKKWLDLWTSRHFENERAEELVRSYGDQVFDLVMNGGASLDEKQQATLDKADALTAEKRFFHWELAFPEVFFDLRRSTWKQNPGFDAVIGNPPYVRMEAFKEIKPFLRRNYDVHADRTDLYGYFIEQAVNLVAEEKYLSFIVSNKWLRANYGEPIREMLVERTAVRRVVDFKDLPVFAGARTYPLVLIASKESDDDAEGQAATVPHLDFANLAALVEDEAVPFQQQHLREAGWAMLSNEGFPLLARLRHEHTRLADYIKSPTLMGVKSGLNEAFVIDEETRAALIEADKKSAEIIYPLRTGRDVRRYWLEEADTYLIYTHHNVDISRYPAIEAHLEPFREQLEDRATEQAWYELQQPQEAYKEFFKQPKIIQPDMAEGVRFFLDDEGYFLSNTAYFLPVEDPYLLVLLNSQLANFYLASTSATYRGGYIRLFGQYVEELPIRQIAFTTPEAERARHVAEAVAAYEGVVEARHREERSPERDAAISPGVAASTGEIASSPESVRDPRNDLFASILALAESHLAADPERADVVHDLLAHLARQMTRLHKQRQHLDAALDPFKFLDRGVAFAPFPEVFAEAIKYGQRLTDGVDLGSVHHDLDGLRLVPEDAKWRLDVLLKKRDPASGWRDWQKDGAQIERAWTPAYHFELPDERARYYQHAFEALDRFADAASFPGGYTRTTEPRRSCAPRACPSSTRRPTSRRWWSSRRSAPPSKRRSRALTRSSIASSTCSTG